MEYGWDNNDSTLCSWHDKSSAHFVWRWRDDSKSLAIVRLWDAGCSLENNKSSTIPRRKPLKFKHWKWGLNSHILERATMPYLETWTYLDDTRKQLFFHQLIIYRFYKRWGSVCFCVLIIGSRIAHHHRRRSSVCISLLKRFWSEDVLLDL